MFPTHKSAIGKALRFPLRLIPPEAVISVLRGPLKGMRWVAGSSVHGCWLGTYESRKVAQMCTHNMRGTQFLDIGANVGFYSLLAHSRGASVIAFEPLPRNLTYLRRHVEMNGANVQIVPQAVSDTVGEGRFDSEGDSSECRLTSSGDLTVSTVTIDSLGLRPDFMKIDVEGGEIGVLHGATETIRNHRPLIFLATHGKVDNTAELCISILESIGYECQLLEDNEYLASPRAQVNGL